MKLHYVVGSPNCRKVHAVLNHLGRSLPFEYHDFFSGELNSPAFLALNPNGMVPVLQDGELMLTESNAIMQYLADGAGGADEKPLYPRDRQRRADVQRWQCWELAHFNKALGVLSFETVAKPGFLNMKPDDAAVAWSSRELARFAPVLDRALEGRDHLVGDGITLADYSVAHLEAFQSAVPFDWKPFANLNAYFERMRGVPHWSHTAPAGPQAIGRRPAPAFRPGRDA
jgi:glutathione S-transferase